MKNYLLSPQTKLNPAARLLLSSGMSFRQKHIKKFLPGHNLMQTVVFCLLFILGRFSSGYGQTFDGNYNPWPGEYDGAFTQVVTPSASTTCQIQQIWAQVITPGGEGAFLLGFKIGNKGAALFRIYVDTDNDPTTGLTTDPQFENLPVAGAEYIFQINSNSGETKLFTGNGSTLVQITDLHGFAGLNGGSDEDGDFLEFFIPFTSIGYNPCDPSGSINISQYASVKGGSENSSLCEDGTLSFEIGAGGGVSPDDIVCPGSTSGIEIERLYWNDYQVGILNRRGHILDSYYSTLPILILPAH